MPHGKFGRLGRPAPDCQRPDWETRVTPRLHHCLLTTPVTVCTQLLLLADFNHVLISFKTHERENYSNDNVSCKDIVTLQRVQNCLARVVSQSPRFSRSVPLLKSPHWLPCDSATCLALSPIKVFHLNNHHIWSQLSRQQDSTDSSERQTKIDLVFLELRKKAGTRLFPRLHTRTILNQQKTFRHLLKTYLFNLGYPP